VRNPVVRFHIEGPAAYGDLDLTGFATDCRITDVVADIAEVLRRRYDAVVSATIEPAMTQAGGTSA
jgi:hypothetical protein